MENIMNLWFVQFFISAKHVRFFHQNTTDFPQETDFSVVIQNSYLTHFLQFFITLGTDMQVALFDFRDLWAGNGKGCDMGHCGSITVRDKDFSFRRQL